MSGALLLSYSMLCTACGVFQSCRFLVVAAGMSAVRPYFREFLFEAGRRRDAVPRRAAGGRVGTYLVCLACSYKTPALEGYSGVHSEEFFPILLLWIE